MAYSPARQRVVLFGGHGGGGWLSDTWEWDGSDWIQRTSAVAPGPRIGAAMAEDPGGTVVLFGGGYNPGGRVQYLGDTWEWNGLWTQRMPATSPDPRAWPGIAFDARRRQVVLYGGSSLVYTGEFPRAMLFTDTWVWDGTRWTQQTPVNHPKRVYGWGNTSGWNSMAYDSGRDRVVFVGSYWDVFGIGYFEDWEWDGTDWTQRFPFSFPYARKDHALAYDERNFRIVMFGGQTPNRYVSETWEYYTLSPATYGSFGTGCAGTAGTPALRTASPFERPWIGGTLHVDVANVPAGNATAILVGASRSQWGAVGLPLSLAPIGMPGCSLLASPDVVLAIPNPAGTATLTLSVPNEPALIGQSFYNQAFVRDPGANFVGVTVSNGGAARIGAR